MKLSTKHGSSLLGSGWFFVSILVLFSVQSLWLACTARFPMAFDEAYHYGLIWYFSHHLNPIISFQAPDTYRYGAILHNPSFLYHYLMSFPYRFISIFTASNVVHVLILRSLNVLFILVSLIIIKKILLLLGTSRSLAHVLIFVFALTPIVTALSAQISYDNLFILATCVALWQLLVIVNELGKGIANAERILVLISICFFASLIKYSFLPIFAGVVVVLFWYLLHHKKSVELHKKYRASFTKIPLIKKCIITGFFLLGLGLSANFYVGNIISYQSLSPQCNQILSIKDCTQYYAWDNNYRDAQYKQSHPNLKESNIIYYSAHWGIVMFFQTYGEIRPLFGLAYYSPLFLSFIGLIGLFGVIGFLLNLRKILQDNHLLYPLLFISFVYGASVFVRNYHDYINLGEPVAISGRYLVPILPYLYLIIGMGFSYQFRKIVQFKVLLATATLLMFLLFGGFTTYIVHTEKSYGKLSETNSFNLKPTS